MSRLKISVVSYLNALPFRYALRNYAGKDDWDVQNDIPSVCADKLIDGTVDLGLIPVAEINRVPNGKVIGKHCIASDGEVKSVLLLSDVPLNEIKTIMLDYQSRTSVRLCKLLANMHWKINPEWINTSPGYENKIKATVAGVVIGDRAIELKDNFKFAYDLSAEWKKHTGLPFVFACWVANKTIDKKDEESLQMILTKGIKNRTLILDEEKVLDPLKRDYILNTIQYEMSEMHEKAIKSFIELSKKFG